MRGGFSRGRALRVPRQPLPIARAAPLAMTKGRAAVLAAVMALGLGGCGDGQLEELGAWMQQQRAASRAEVPALAPPLPFVPLAYESGQSPDPFNPQKLALVLRKDAGEAALASRLLGPELNRPRQPLESFTLESMRMVGSLMRQGQRVALVRIEQQVHVVRAGQYLGQNYGRITQITETGIHLREIVQDGAGEWAERSTVLSLQEKSS